MTDETVGVKAPEKKMELSMAEEKLLLRLRQLSEGHQVVLTIVAPGRFWIAVSKNEILK